MQFDRGLVAPTACSGWFSVAPCLPLHVLQKTVPGDLFSPVFPLCASVTQRTPQSLQRPPLELQECAARLSSPLSQLLAQTRAPPVPLRVSWLNAASSNCAWARGGCHCRCGATSTAALAADCARRFLLTRTSSQCVGHTTRMGAIPTRPFVLQWPCIRAFSGSTVLWYRDQRTPSGHALIGYFPVYYVC
jgi:hypothetical protein